MTDDPAAPRTRLDLGLLQTLATITLVVFVLKSASSVLIPIALAVLFVFILSPLVRLLEGRKLPRWAAVLATLLITVSLVGGIGYIIAEQATSLAKTLPEKQDQIKAKIDGIRNSDGPFSKLFEMIDKIAKGDAAAGQTADQIAKGDAAGQTAKGTPAGGTEKPKAEATKAPAPSAEPAKSGVGSLLETVAPILEPLVNAALVAILVIFMLMNREDMRNRLIGLFGRGRVTGTTRVMSDAAERVSKFLLYQLIVNASFGLVLAVGLYFIGVPNAPLWGFLSGLLRFIPFVGTWVSMLFPFAISFATSDGWTQPLMVFGFFAVLDLATANVVEPMLFGHQTGVAPIALLVAAAFWAWVWGPIGLLLSTPITVCLAVLGQHVPRLRPLATLIGDQPALAPHVAFYQRLLAKDQLETKALLTPPPNDPTPNPVLAKFDATAVPAVLLARRDRASEDISAEEETEMYDAVETVVHQVEYPALQAGTAGDASRAELREATARLPVLVGAPAHHRAEELVLHMLAMGLPPVGRRLVGLTARQLPADVEAAIAENGATICVVAIVPPGGVPQAQYLIKRLSAKFPKLVIIGAYFGRTSRFDELLVRLRRSGATYVTTSLSQTADTIRTLTPAPPPPLAPAKPAATAPESPPPAQLLPPPLVPKPHGGKHAAK